MSASPFLILTIRLMYNPSTKRTHISRDVVFTKKMFYREDFSISSDKEYPLGTSFENLRITVDEASSNSSSTIEQPPVDLLPPQPVNPPLVKEVSEDEDDMPSLSVRPDIENISTIADTAPTIDDDSTIDNFNNDAVFVLPDPPTSPNTFEELSLPPDDPVPDFIDIRSPLPSDDETTSTHSLDERPFHTVTRRGRKFFTPEHFRHQPASNALTILPNPYSIFDLNDETEGDSETENEPLFEAPPPPRISMHRSVYGVKHSGKTFSNFTNSMAKAMDFISSLSAPPPVLPESALVGASGSAFHHTNELQVMKLYQALQSDDKEAWKAAIADELARFKKHSVFEVVPKKLLLPRTRLLSSTWNMKKKANGVFRARLIIRGFEQVPNIHYRPEWISAPVSNAVPIRIKIVLLLMMGGYAHVIDGCSAFLLGLFDSDDERVYVSIPNSWERFFQKNVVLLLLKTVHGLKQVANCFYRLLVSVMSGLQFQKSAADPCLYWVRGFSVWQRESVYHATHDLRLEARLTLDESFGNWWAFAWHFLSFRLLVYN